MTDTTSCLEVHRSDHARTRIVEVPLGDLAPGQVRLRVDRFALTANNVTYAVAGDMLGYWDFFPASDGWGRVPAMGWGDVVASAHPDVSVGGRYYGWYPMARHVDLAVSTTAEGLRDDGPHRAAHAPVYRAYLAADRDPFYEPGAEGEDRQALLRGLFVTAFLADDCLADHDYHGARRVIVLSASSKTAIGFAQRASARGLDEVVGVTSPRNAAFVRSLGWYDRVVGYGEIETLATDRAALVVDMAGDGAVLERVHAHFGERLRHSMAIGLSHHDGPARPSALGGPQPEFFFAPTQVKKRIGDWGAEGYRERLAAALREFSDASRKWLEIVRSRGSEAAARAWQEVYDGRTPPSAGHIVSLWDSAR